MNSYDNIKKEIEDKIKESLDQILTDKLKKLVTEETDNFEYRKIEFIKEGKPENYVRERSGRGRHFYNPKQSVIDDYKNYFLHQMSKEDYDYTRELIKNPDAEYYVALDVAYFLPIPVNDSNKKKVLKELGVTLPAIRPDLDNYDKLLIDSLHNVVFDDDKRIFDIHSSKAYSLVPRTDFSVIIVKKI